MIRAQDRGFDVRLIADRSAPYEQREGIEPVAAAGIPVWIDSRARLAHEKALIFDRRFTIMGSYNFSAAASPEVAEAYADHWQSRQTVSVRFTDASQWCQR